ncbi:hypothetical protein [Crocosphaera chwakensis]|uniref:Uncharacterized protein n=1 Tax=Crocosphaera chwakensis CCY0110 TaxID=391612 RepID=A3IZA2_9CHRO|nr:hypothetical protein [Crocosphaera chwakensis]EAZ88193.1 hypothetical protein CY0110_14670 [Crocosphaera chwakensis CCY0110]
MLIPRQAQTSTNDFLSYLGTEPLTIYHQDELKYGQFKGETVNNLTPENLSGILQSIEQNQTDNQTDWEIRQGSNLLLSNNYNQLQLAVGTNRLQLGVKQNELTLGDALIGHWLIEDELNKRFDSNQESFDFLPFYLTLRKSMANLSNSTINVNQELTNPLSSQPSLVTSPSTYNQSKITSNSNSSNEDIFFPLSFSDNQLNLEGSEDKKSINSLHSNQSNPFQNPAFLHHLFSQLHQRKKLRYHQGKAILTINNSETLVAQLNEQNQWEYVSGTLSQTSLNELQYELNSSQSIRYPPSSQSSNFTL